MIRFQARMLPIAGSMAHSWHIHGTTCGNSPILHERLGFGSPSEHKWADERPLVVNGEVNLSTIVPFNHEAWPAPAAKSCSSCGNRALI